MAMDEERLVVTLEARVRDFERNFARAQTTSERRLSAIEARASTSAKRLQTTFDTIGSSAGASMLALGSRTFAGLAGAFSAREIAQAAAQYTNLQNALKVTGLEGEDLREIFDTLFQIAQRNGTAIEPLVTLYSRLSQAQAELGATSEELTTFTDGISLALRVGGTSADQASGALLQLSQALGGAVVRAEEFNSMMEGAPTIVQTVARGLDEAGGSVAKLRGLVVDGKVSSEAFFRAFLAGMGGLEEQAAKTTGTVSQGLSRVSNAFVLLVGKLDETTGASASAATNLSAVADAIEGIPRYVDAAIDGLRSLRSWLSEVGNNPIWKQIGEALGVDYSPEGMKKYGITYTPEGTANRAGSGRRGGAPMAPRRTETVSIDDYKTEDDKAGAKAKETQGLADAYDRLVQSAESRIAQMEIERQAIGLTTGEAEKLRVKQDLLNELHRAGITDASQYAAQIDDIASRAGLAAQALEEQAKAQGRLVESLDIVRGTAYNVMGGFVDDLRNGVSAADALNNVLGRVLDTIIEIALQEAITGLDGKAGTSGGGSLGDLLGSTLGAVFGIAGARADGGPIAAGKTYLVGERGPELIRPRSAGYVVPNHAFGRAGGSGAGAADPMYMGGGKTLRFNMKVENRVSGVGVQLGRVGPSASGGVDFEMIIDQIEGRLADNVSKRNGPLGAAMEMSYGLNPMRGRSR